MDIVIVSELYTWSFEKMNVHFKSSVYKNVWISEKNNTIKGKKKQWHHNFTRCSKLHCC